MTRNFNRLIQARWEQGKFICVGLDTDIRKLPASVWTGTNKTIDGVCKFNAAIVEATRDLVCAFKPNIAFYEGMNGFGMEVLLHTMHLIHTRAPDAPVILDAKRGDIGTSNEGYIRSAFERLDADAITIHPYMGREANQPYLDCSDKGIFVLCRTSNPGAGEFQDLQTLSRNPRDKPEGMSAEEWLAILCSDNMSLYQRVADNVATKWNANGNCGLVVGATCPGEIGEVREIAGDMPILFPGVGAQGGDLEKTIKNGKDSRGKGMIVSLSRSVLSASKGPDFADAARAEIERSNAIVRSCL